MRVELKIDAHDWVPVDDTGFLLTGVATSGEHTVRVRKNGTQTESFRFGFSTDPARNRVLLSETGYGWAAKPLPGGGPCSNR